MAAAVPGPPGTQTRSQREISASRRVPAKVSPPWALTSPPRTEATTVSEAGSRLSTSHGPVKSSWVSPSKMAKTVTKGSAGMGFLSAGPAAWPGPPAAYSHARGWAPQGGFGPMAHDLTTELHDA